MNLLKQIASRFRFIPRGFYILEPHRDWARRGEIPLEDIAERVYGRPWSSLAASSADEVDGTLPNGALVELDFRDRDCYEEALEKFDSRELYLGRDPAGNELTKIGLTQMEYWLSIQPTADANIADYNKFTAEGRDLEGALVHSYDGTIRQGIPGLRMVVADLIRRGELPRGRFLFRHWW